MDNAECIAKWLWVSTVTNLARSRLWLPVFFFALLLPRQVVAPVGVGELEALEAAHKAYTAARAELEALDEPYKAEPYNAAISGTSLATDIEDPRTVLDEIKAMRAIQSGSFQHFYETMRKITFPRTNLPPPVDVVYFEKPALPKKEAILCSINRAQFFDGYRTMVEEKLSGILLDATQKQVKESILGILNIMGTRIEPSPSIKQLVIKHETMEQDIAEAARESDHFYMKLRETLSKDPLTKLQLTDSQIGLVVTGLQSLGLSLSESHPNSQSYKQWLSLYNYAHPEFPKDQFPEINWEGADKWASGKDSDRTDADYSLLYNEHLLLKSMAAAVDEKLCEKGIGLRELSSREKKVPALLLSLSNFLLTTEAKADDLQELPQHTRALLQTWIGAAGVETSIVSLSLFLSVLPEELATRLDEACERIETHAAGNMDVYSSIDNVVIAVEVIKDIFAAFVREPLTRNFFEEFESSYKAPLGGCRAVHMGLKDRNSFPTTYHPCDFSKIHSSCDSCQIMLSSALPPARDWSDDYYNFSKTGEPNTELHNAVGSAANLLKDIKAERLKAEEKRAQERQKEEEKKATPQTKGAGKPPPKQFEYQGWSAADGNSVFGNATAGTLAVMLAAAVFAFFAFVVVSFLKSQRASQSGFTLQNDCKH